MGWIVAEEGKSPFSSPCRKPSGGFIVSNGETKNLIALPETCPKQLVLANRRAPRSVASHFRLLQLADQPLQSLLVDVVIFLVPEVANHFLKDIGFAGVLPFIEQVIVNTDRKQDARMLFVFAPQSPVDLAEDGPCENVKRTPWTTFQWAVG